MKGLEEYNQQQDGVDGFRLKYYPIRELTIGTIQLAWAKAVDKDGDKQFTHYTLISEMDLKGGLFVDKKGKTRWLAEDDRNSIYKQLANQLRIHEIKTEIANDNENWPKKQSWLSVEDPKYLSSCLSKEQQKKLVKQLFEKHKQGEWIGQTRGDHTALFNPCIQEILGLSPMDTHKLCMEMFREQTIALSGNMITDWNKNYLPVEESLEQSLKAFSGSEEVIEGQTTFYSETGTEGGYWAVQDNRYISWKTPEWGLYKNQNVKDKITGQTGKVLKKLSKSKNIKEAKWLVDFEGVSRYIFKEDVTTLQWDYKGLHLLKTGDWIEIYGDSKMETCLWRGYVHLRKFTPFTESANNMWIHSEQIDLDRKIWAEFFQDQYFVKLSKKQAANKIESS